MLKRIYAIFRARNLEFIRDRGTMAWNFVLPVMLMFGLLAFPLMLGRRVIGRLQGVLLLALRRRERKGGRR